MAFVGSIDSKKQDEKAGVSTETESADKVVVKEEDDAKHDDNDEADETESDESADESDSSQKTFTQDEVKKMMTREKKQGRNAAFNELGINPADKKLLAMIKALAGTDKEMQEDDVVDPRVAEAEQRAEMAELKADALAAGVMPQFIDDAITLISKRLNEEDGSERKDVIADLKKKYSSWFSNSGDEAADKAKHGTGSAVGALSNKDSLKGASFGKRLAASRAKTVSSSYFKN